MVEDWPWSSYRATIGQIEGPACLNIDWLLAGFAKRKSVAIERYKTFVAEGKGQASPWGLLRNQIYLGSETFVEEMQSRVDCERNLDEVPSSQRRPVPKSIAEYEASSRNRNDTICKAYQSGGYTLKEIGGYFGLHYSSVSGIIKNHKSKT